jgi:hypothetical protein
MAVHGNRVDEIDMSDPNEIGWELLSYLALEPARQEELVGPAEEWFCREDPEINPGSNYLLGVACALSTYKNGFVDSADLGYDSALFELNALLELMIFSSDMYFWTIKDLYENYAWRLVRRLARATLEEAGLESNPPEKPFFLPDLLDVGCYPLKNLPGGGSL